MTCLECDQPAVWVRHTQFSGEHPYCDQHARREPNFGQSDPSYFYWRPVMTQAEFDKALPEVYEEIRRGWNSLPLVSIAKAMKLRRGLPESRFPILLEAGLRSGALSGFEVQRATGEGYWIFERYVGALVKRDQSEG